MRMRTALSVPGSCQPTLAPVGRVVEAVPIDTSAIEAKPLNLIVQKLARTTSHVLEDHLD
jgi:hypothetical protein